MEEQQAKIIATQDGSPTIYLPDLDETYHSRHGAVQESQHVFIQEGLDFIASSNLNVLEVGMGTGLNLLLSYLWSREKETSLKLVSLEPFPIEHELAAQLNFDLDEDAHALLQELHSKSWSAWHERGTFQWRKEKTGLMDYRSEQQYDLVFYDAFGPRAQSEMWDEKHIQKIGELTASGGHLVTYCSQGQFRRNLKAAGFEVEKIPGPPGKREMVRAQKV